MTTDTTNVAPVRKTVVVQASVEHAFKGFTAGFDLLKIFAETAERR